MLIEPNTYTDIKCSSNSFTELFALDTSLQRQLNHLLSQGYTIIDVQRNSNGSAHFAHITYGKLIYKGLK